MKKINLILGIILVLLTTSCKSQVNSTKTSHIVSSIQDSIVCNKKVISKYKLPFFSFESKKSTAILNNIIKKEVEEFVFTDREVIIDSTSLKKTITNFTNYINAKCCINKCYSFIGSNYSIHFINEHIISIQLNIETLTAYPTEYSYVYNFDIDNSKLLTVEDLFINTNNKLIDQINKRVNNKFPDELKINEIPDLWFITKNQEGILGINFANGLVENLRAFGNEFNLYEVFFTFTELKPYLTEEFKEQLGL